MKKDNGKRGQDNRPDLANTIQRIVEASGKVTPGINHVFIEHERGCPALKSQSLLDCRCNPDIKIKPTMDA